MRVNFPGLLIERHRNGTARIRVRVEGQPGKRVHIPVGPDDPQYKALGNSMATVVVKYIMDRMRISMEAAG